MNIEISEWKWSAATAPLHLHPRTLRSDSGTAVVDCTIGSNKSRKSRRKKPAWAPPLHARFRLLRSAIRRAASTGSFVGPSRRTASAARHRCAHPALAWRCISGVPRTPAALLSCSQESRQSSRLSAASPCSLQCEDAKIIRDQRVMRADRRGLLESPLRV